MPIRALGVLLCYNDGDLLEDSIKYLLDQNHHVLIWDHGSSDETPEVIRRFHTELVEATHVPRTVDFYDLYPAMSQHLLKNYVTNYDWVSWPDQDEFLEGPSRAHSYYEWLQDVFESSYNWIRFNNFNYWYTASDNPAIRATPSRVRHYALFPDCAPRIRSWRSSATNIRLFNHNPPEGSQWPVWFNLRHYPMRSRQQMIARLEHDRAGIRRGASNYHYEYMKSHMDEVSIAPENLHYDDGESELSHDPIFNWRLIYGYGPAAESE
jgi:Glycosyl transferase family 2